MSDKLYINDNQLNGYLPYSQNCYAMTNWALYQFLSKCTDSDTFTNMGKGFTQPLDFVNFIRVYPYNIIDYTYTLSTVYLFIGNTGIGIDTSTAKYPTIIGTCKRKIHITKTFTNVFGSTSKFNQVYPYVQVDCYLPYVGFVKLDINELRTSNNTIKVDLVIDALSGYGVYSISKYDITTQSWYVFYTTQTNFATDIAIGGTNGALQAQKVYNNTMQTTIGIATALTGGAFGSRYGMTRGLASTVEGIVGSVTNNQENVISRGSNGNFPTSFNNPHAIYFIVKTKKVSDYDSFKSVYGKPLNESVALNNLKGMTYIPNPKIEIPNITSNEYEELVTLMQNGIILSKLLIVDNVKLKGTYKLKDKIKVSNVKLYGNYDEWKIKLSNVILNGTYRLIDKIIVSNVAMLGTYDEFKVKLSNIKLKGTYNLLDKLIVTNVKLKGLYDEYKVKVNNIKLNGTYLLQPKIEVSNVALSGSYDEYKIKISNVALSGIYNIMHNIEVSNVALKGTYEQEISNYTLTINFYKDSSLYNTITQEYASGTTISPASIATEYLPTDYEVDTTEPTSDFVINEDTTLSVYYKAQSGEITDLTGYTWIPNNTLSVLPTNFKYIFFDITRSDGVIETVDYGGIVQGSSPICFAIQVLVRAIGLDTYFYKIGDGIRKLDYYLTSISFTGGTDATNTELIAWLQENGTLTKK